MERILKMFAEKHISPARKMLVVDDDSDFRWAITNVLRGAGYRVAQAQDGDQALSLLEKDIPDMIFLDYRMPGQNGQRVAEVMRRRFPAIPIIMISAYADVKSVVKAIKIGVHDYITKPIDNSALLFTIQRAFEKKNLVQEIEHLRKVISERDSLYKLMGKSDQIKKLSNLVERVAPTLFTVLIEGESGTGKELVARAIHDMSMVKKGPFVAVDCGAIPETLIESELFGYTKGAFTGAVNDKPGQFELANGGTLFLDEVGNLPYTAQQKLLRALQERCIQRLGAQKTQPIQVRAIAATNQSLEKDVESGRFRSDLFFRLKEFAVKVPALRERKEDIPYLTKKFMKEVQVDLDKNCGGFSKAALGSMLSYHWPGNVRELRNVIRQAALLCEENVSIKPDQLAFSTHLTPGVTEQDAVFASLKPDNGKKPLKETIKSFVDVLEKKIITQTIAETKGNKSEAARRLEIDYKTLLRKIKIHGLDNDHWSAPAPTGVQG